MVSRPERRGAVRIERRDLSYPRVLSLLAALSLLCLVYRVARAAEAPAREVHLHIFLSSTCPHCELVEEEPLRKLSEKLGCTIVPHYYDVDSMAEYKRLVALERRMGDTRNDLPAVFLGEHVLGGVPEIEESLEGLIEGYAATGLPPIEVPSAEEADQALKAAAGAAGAAPGTIRLAYFEEPGCRQCARAERVLGLAEARFPQMEVRRFGTRTNADRVLLEVLCERAGVPEDRRLIVPAIFVGRRALIREDIGDDELDAALTGPSGDASVAVWEATPQDRLAAERRLAERAAGMGIAAVALGGLVDGVNPCAFATLVFFVCCLAGAGSRRGVILAVGLFFTIGVFVAYFLTGVGLSEVLLRLDVVPRLSQALTWIIIAATFALAAVSFWDFASALRGRAREMVLKLPERLRLRINAIIARRLHARSAAVGAFGIGATVSMLEFVCTGQVYLPLIRYMTAISSTRVRALELLVLYDLAFVLPLVIVFAATYFGVGSERLAAGFRRHVAPAKLALALFFLGLGALLVHIELGRAL